MLQTVGKALARVEKAVIMDGFLSFYKRVFGSDSFHKAFADAVPDRDAGVRSCLVYKKRGNRHENRGISALNLLFEFFVFVTCLPDEFAERV